MRFPSLRRSNFQGPLKSCSSRASKIKFSAVSRRSCPSQTVRKRGLLGFSAAAGGTDVIEGDGATTEEDEREGEGGEGQRKFVTVLAQESIMEVNFGDGDGQIDAYGKGGGAGEEADDHEQSAKEFAEGGEIAHPCGQPQAGDEMNVLLQAVENFMITVADHDGAEGETHDQKREGLQSIEVAQMVPPCEKTA